MSTGLTPQQEADRLAFREFVEGEVVPRADEFDRAEAVPPELIRKLAARGYLGAVVPEEYGGRGMGAVALGLLNEEVGRGCSSVRSLLTVHHMVSLAVLRWGTEAQRRERLPRLASGESVAAFALTEPNAGSDARQIETAAERDGDAYVLDGEKKWISFGQVADLFLVFARCGGGSAAFLVPREAEGLTVKAVGGLLGTRASMPAELRLEHCRVPAANLVGREGFALSHVAASALDYGRYSVAWGCAGLLRACLEASVRRTSARRQFGSLLKDHQLIRRMITDMMTDARAARLLCLRAGQLKEAGDPSAPVETLVAKYFAARAAMRAASDAVQIHGAVGCSAESSVSRYFRDAKVMEIIEGSNEIQQLSIADYGHLDL